MFACPARLPLVRGNAKCLTTWGVNGLQLPQSSSSTTAGLMGIIGLNNPEDFERLAEDAIEKSRVLTREAVNTRPGPATIDLIDEISDTVCQVADVAEFIGNMHSSNSWRNAANRAAMIMGARIRELNAHEGLASILSAVLNQASVKSGDPGNRSAKNTPLIHDGKAGEFSREALLVGRRLMWDFQKAGIHLDATARRRIEELRGLEQGVCMEFCQAVQGSGESKKSVSLQRDELVCLPPFWRRRARPQGDAWCLTADFHILRNLLSGVESGALRQRIYMACLQSLPGNLLLLDNLIKIRHEIANIIGADSYARIALKHSIAEAPEAVDKFLNLASTTVRPIADEEIKILKTVKGNGEVSAWDLWYYMNRAESCILQGPTQPVFNLEGVLGGLAYLVRVLFGITLQMQPLSVGEAWADDVIKFVAVDGTQGDIGYLYLDLYDRTYKYAGNAHFTVRCGRRLPEGSYQKPVVALVSRFPRNKKVLRYGELKTLLHEFGHALNSLLCKTEYQHLFGTRGPLDVVEIPSHLMEHFASNPIVLELMGAQDPSGHKATSAAIKHLLALDQLWNGFSIQEQAIYALIDQQLFGPNPPGPGATSQVMKSIICQHSSILYVPATHKQVWDTHLTNYGASYYSYLYATSLAALIWHKHFENDPLSEKAGRHIRTMLLEPGGAKEPRDLISGALDDRALVPVQEGWMPTPDTWIKSCKTTGI